LAGHEQEIARLGAALAEAKAALAAAQQELRALNTERTVVRESRPGRVFVLCVCNGGVIVQERKLLHDEIHSLRLQSSELDRIATQATASREATEHELSETRTANEQLLSDCDRLAAIVTDLEAQATRQTEELGNARAALEMAVTDRMQTQQQVRSSCLPFSWSLGSC
jgi:hypothetical protein